MKKNGVNLHWKSCISGEYQNWLSNEAKLREIKGKQEKMPSNLRIRFKIHSLQNHQKRRCTDDRALVSKAISNLKINKNRFSFVSMKCYKS